MSAVPRRFSDDLRQLVWFPEKGYGFLGLLEEPAPYDQAYFDRYRELQETELGIRLILARRELVAKHVPNDTLVLDVGIGAGGFVESRRSWGCPTFGFDINPAAVEWLRGRNLYRDAYIGSYPAATFWDSLEHLEWPEKILSHITGHVFVSIPIFSGPDHVLRSRHFRRDEHVLYFTRDGFIRWMGDRGWTCLEHNTMESLMGREDIHTFVFRREG